MESIIKICIHSDGKQFISSSLIQLVTLNLMSSEECNISKTMIMDATGIDENVFYSSFIQVGVDDFAKLLLFCRLKKDSFKFFYTLGYTKNSIHYQLLGSITEYLLTSTNKVESSIHELLLNEINILDLYLKIDNNVFECFVEVHNDFRKKYKNAFKPFVYLIHGFLDRMMNLLFGWTSESIQYSMDKKLENSKKADLHLQVNGLPAQNKMYELIDLKSVLLSKFIKLREIESRLSIEQKTKMFLNRDICFTLDEIASLMSISPRSLQRKLKMQDASFSKIKEDMRKDLVQTYLKDDSISIAEISDLLGYSERSAFERAFKKWFKTNPREYRNRIQNNED